MPGFLVTNCEREDRNTPKIQKDKLEGGIMKSLDLNQEQLQKMKSHPGFIAALDQSGGSTPKALAYTESK